MQHLSNIIKTIISRFTDDQSTSESIDSESQQQYKALNNAFLEALSGKSTPIDNFYKKYKDSADHGSIVRFYTEGLKLIRQELESIIISDSEFAKRLHDVSGWCTDRGQEADISDLADQVWRVFFPEAVGIDKDAKKSIAELREKRSVRVTKLNDNPVKSPLNDMIFTSNVLLTVPSDGKKLEELGLNPSVEKIIKQSMSDKQLYWYDHPIQIGVESDKNEVLYGMRALNEAVAYEKENSSASPDKKLTCILSASVTHEMLHQIAQHYLEDEFHHGPSMENLDLYLFTESETDQLISEILVPAAEKYLNCNSDEARDLLQVIGVDGEYGRHYSFLKAISAFWKVFIDPTKKATFKIDLDQVFPQDILVKETGFSAFEHLCSPLWGAEGIDTDGDPVDLGMIAGALVNEKDIHISLFTPDVPIPEGVETADELVFFSKLPQAISTEAEMLTRYDSDKPDGKETCIQRVHVTGGTNGILVDRLFKYRPFTPSFFGRAEDQAYIMSVIDRDEKNLTYVHGAGLIMRHDKEAFAQEAMKVAHIGKLVGDYTRILLFSAYSELLSAENFRIKNWLDPFTGCFISKIPITVVFLRFALKAKMFFQKGKMEEGVDFINNGSNRISETLKFISSDFDSLYRKERKGWDLYYDILSACESALKKGDTFAEKLKLKANKLIQEIHLNI
jgi:hypothetical protein